MLFLRLEFSDDLLDIALPINRKTTPETKCEAKLQNTLFDQAKTHLLGKNESTLFVELCRSGPTEEEFTHNQ